MKTYENYIILWKVSFFLSSLGNSPVDFFLKLQFQSINRTKLVCLGLVHENDDALSEIILSNGDVCAPYTHPTPWLQNWPISHQHRSDNFDLHKSFCFEVYLALFPTAVTLRAKTPLFVVVCPVFVPMDQLFNLITCLSDQTPNELG